MKTNKIVKVVLVVFCITTLISCAPQGYTKHNAGFLEGLWHGFIIIFSIIGKLIGKNVGIYAAHNTGVTYWLGFILGLGVLGGGGNSARR